MPGFWVNLGQQVFILRFDVFDANTNKSWHRAYNFNYFGRNSAGNSFFSFLWDGTTVNGKKVNVVPGGEYVIVISVLKALGDDSSPDHWETWSSPAISIDRP